MRVCNVHKSRRERERERERDDEKRMLAILYLVLLYVRLSLNCDLFFSRAHRKALFEETLKSFFVEMMRWKVLFFSSCVSFFKKIFSNLSDADALAKNDSVTKKKKNSPPLLLKKDIEKRCACEICRNEKQRRRRIRRVVLNRGVLRGSTREEEDVTMRVKRLIVAYGRRTWTREAWMFPRFRFRRIP